MLIITMKYMSTKLQIKSHTHNKKHFFFTNSLPYQKISLTLHFNKKTNTNN